MTDDPAALTERWLARARELGFAAVGVCEAAPSPYADEVRRWIAEGRHGSMAWLAETIEARLDPRRLLEGARSVLCIADRYAGPGRDPEPPAWPPRGRVARYARGEDYHEVMRRRLRRLAAEIRAEHAGHDCRIACDLLPILERELAARAGLGRIGKHTLLIESAGTSYLVLGEILTTLELVPSAPIGGDPCADCTRCIDACPTEAITPYSVDASRCLAYSTIEHRGALDERFWNATGEWLFGCDICQEVCPHVAPTRAKRRLPINDAYAPRFERGLDLLAILGWSERDRLAATVRSALRRATLPMLKRNAIVCLVAAARRLGPERVAAIRARLERVAGDPDEDALVRSTARSGLERLAAGRVQETV
jgi:epoxyqueuosine reductase